MNKRAIVFTGICSILIVIGALGVGFASWMLFAAGEQFAAFESYNALIFSVIAALAAILFMGVIRMARQINSN